MLHAAPPQNDLLLPDQPAPVDEKQRALTAQYLVPFQADIFDFLMDIRLSLDPALSHKYPSTQGKPYPLGRCLEITNAVRHELLIRLSKPQNRAAVALRAFLDNGGLLRPIWGALRGLYFQNATQIGGLYVDVSNDTVNVEKPKVEILPIENCDLAPIQNIRHFVDVAVQYWGVDIYVNSVIPSLSPLFPMIGVQKSGKLDLLLANDYMIALSMRTQFLDAQLWLSDGPLPPDHIVHKIQRHIPASLCAKVNAHEAAESIKACNESRQARKYLDQGWRDESVRTYLHVKGLLMNTITSPGIM